LNIRQDCGDGAIKDINLPLTTFDEICRFVFCVSSSHAEGKSEVLLESRNRAPKRPDTVEFHSRAVQRVVGSIRQRLDENISLAEMASVAYMSRYHFNRTFRQVTGLPPRRFLSKLRVEAATRMLLTTDSSVTDICLDVGYSSLGTFVRRFSGLLGISPRKLRQLRQSPSKNLLEGLDLDVTNGDSLPQPGMVGRVHGPASFSGPIFIGLFPTPIPERKPVACATITQPGEFVISRAPKGQYYVLALGLPWPDTVDDFFRYDAALRGGGQLVNIGESTLRCDDILLRAAASTDPPVLLNLPLLLGKNRELRNELENRQSAGIGQ
jgi:AraC family transcriptional regulator